MLQPPIESKQYVSIVYNERLEEHGISAFTDTVGDSYDNTMAENVNGLSQERTDP
ncbi:transposase-like protein [Corynebacterium diphtheriae C7 (beta)]|uniref:Transposase n=1 Tax=Corynebacterium diphtheriae bv. gravis TaxID=1720349 RepID=A0AAX0J1R8_CORDP|nr:transposase-like protein [Corynebacterium diphtheriae C7 (beta)]OKY23071.1 transposase [Corynebacterium diphtheriae bv. gravis]